MNFYTLSNGVRVAINQVNVVGTVSIGYGFMAGSRQENLQNNGVAHFLEHLFFKGSKNFPEGDFFEREDQVGAYLNAYTGKERTYYYINAHKDFMDDMLFMLNDMLVNPTFPQKKIDDERGVVCQEIDRALDDHERADYYLSDEITFSNHPLGRKNLGTKDNVNSLSRDQILDFRNQNYSANNLIICISGNCDEEKTIKKLEKITADLPKGIKVEVEDAIFNKGVGLQSRDMSQLRYSFRYPGFCAMHNQKSAAELMGTIFGGGMSSRLGKKIREEMGLTYNISASHTSFCDVGYLEISTGIEPENSEIFEQELKHQLLKICDDISEEELNKSKNMKKGSSAIALESMESTAHGMFSSIVETGKLVSPQETIELYERVGLEEVKDVANAIFSGKPSIAVVGRDIETTMNSESLMKRFTL